jgi:hypothetical protein
MPRTPESLTTVTSCSCPTTIPPPPKGTCPLTVVHTGDFPEPSIETAMSEADGELAHILSQNV